jgi:hypothetical protein
MRFTGFPGESPKFDHIDWGTAVFLDENARLIDDPDHSEDEDRFVLLGISEVLRVLVVCHCYRQDGSVIRIISARRADTEERSSYDAKMKR